MNRTIIDDYIELKETGQAIIEYYTQYQIICKDKDYTGFSIVGTYKSYTTANNKINSLVENEKDGREYYLIKLVPEVM